MERGGVEQQIIEQCWRQGQPLPPAIANAPELLPGLGLYMQAFWELSSCRPIGFGEGPIPWSAIAKYARMNGFDAQQEAALFHHTRLLDIEYLKFQQKKRDSKNAHGKNRPGIQAPPKGASRRNR